MAAKLNMLKLLMENRGIAKVTNRRPPSRSPGLFLAQLRAEGDRTALRRQRLSITIDPSNQPEVPLQVKIHHVKQDPRPAAPAPAP
jgi:hypothetical protein